MSVNSAPRASRPWLKWLVALGVVAAVVVGRRGVGAARRAPRRRLPASRSSPLIRTIPTAFTQGLAIEAGQLYEGTGQYGASTVRRVDLASGRPEKQRALGPRYFGEGIAILDGLLYQLTWQNGVVVVYDLETFEVERTMQYDGEGWGLTHDGRQLIMSDGSATIRFRDPQTFAVTREIEVRDRRRAVAEVERARVHRRRDLGEHLVRRSHRAHLAGRRRGARVHRPRARCIRRARASSEAVLNGIAYDAAAKRLFVTGKNWPQLYEIEVARP